MKRLKHLTALLCALALVLGLLPAASAAGAPVSSRNINAQDYTTYGSTVKSYLYENSQGGVTRVEYTGGSVVVEDYDSAYSLTDSRTLQAELPLWGGFFAGEDANFLIFGQKNSGQSNSAEVIRVVKYSKDWQRQGQASLNGANTTVPFDAGSLRCAEYGGYLYIRTCHEMYKSSDGYNHQSNLTMAVRQSDMSVTDSYYDVMNSSYGYISHSFNQFIIVDQDGKLVTLDHGDAYPRGVVFCKYYADAGTGKFTGAQYGRWCSCGNMIDFAGSAGNNTTGGSIGGLAETTDCYVMAYNYDGKAGTGPRDAYYHYMDKASGKSWSVKLTNGTPGVTTPALAPMGLDGGYVMWNGKSGSTPNDTLYYLAYGADGKPGETKAATAPLSDCQPIYHDGKAVWYVTNNSTPTFYGLDDSGVTVLGGGSGSSASQETPAAPSTPTTPTAPSTPTAPTAPSTPSTPTTPAAPSTPGTPTTPTTPNTPSSSKLTVENSMLNHSFSGIFFGGGVDTGAAVTADGDLYVWGDREDLPGDMPESSPTKIADGYIAAGMYWAVKSDNSLYVWKGNSGRQALTKVMDNVLCADDDGYLVLKTDGTLWRTDGGNYTNPIQVLSNVKQFDSGSTFYAVTKDGSLYSYDAYSSSGKFEKIMGGVAACSTSGGVYTLAIKTDGSLWAWGLLKSGTGDLTSPSDAIKIMDNVVSVDAGALLAVTADGTLYELGKDEDLRSAPVRVSDGAAAVRGDVLLKQDGSLWSVSDVRQPFKLLDNVKLSTGASSSSGNSGSSGSSTTPSTPTTPTTSKPSTATPSTPSTTSKPSTTTTSKPNTTTPTTPSATTSTPSATSKPSTSSSSKTNPFTDVPDSAYYKDAVLWALEKNITTGVTPTQFQPNAACTRGQVVTFLWRAKGCPEPKTKTNPFKDVSASSPFYKAILWAQENGITSGTSATTFNPSGTCTSGHVVTFLWRANGEPAAGGASALAEPGRYYTDAVAWADGEGLLSGTGSAFSASAQSPRADIVTYLYRDLAG